MILLRLYFEWIKVREELNEGLVGVDEAVEQPDIVGGCDAGLVLWVSVRSRAV